MQPEPSKANHNISTQQNDSQSSPTSQHGQPRDDDLQDSLLPHPGERSGDPEPPTGGTQGDATRANATGHDESTAENVGLRGIKATTPAPRDRISEYENARIKTPKKPSEGPLFEVIKSNRKDDDKNSPISKLPNGEFIFIPIRK